MQKSKCKSTLISVSLNQREASFGNSKRRISVFLWQAMTLWIVVILVVSLGGCAPRGVRGVRAFEDLPPAEGEVMSDVQFLFDLSKKEYCSTDDAYRGMLYLIDGKDTSKDFEERTARLIMHKVVKKSWQHSCNEVVSKGKVAYMLVRALGIRGGIMYNITNASARYSLRELVFMGIIKDGTEYSKVSGAEYVGILGRAEDRRQAGEEYKCY